MSTRSEALIKSNRNRIHFYHHCDGYYEGVGKLLVGLVTEFAVLQDKNKWFLTEELFSALLKHEFEITDSEHGDLEYVYVVDMKNKTIMGAPATYSLLGRKMFNYDIESNPEAIDMLEMFPEWKTNHDEK